MIFVYIYIHTYRIRENMEGDANHIFYNRGVKSTRSTQYGNDRLFSGKMFQHHNTTQTRETVANINSTLGLKGNHHLIYHAAHTGMLYNGNNTRNAHMHT
jgi:hypothetical protein